MVTGREGSTRVEAAEEPGTTTQQVDPTMHDEHEPAAGSFTVVRRGRVGMKHAAARRGPFFLLLVLRTKTDRHPPQR